MATLQELCDIANGKRRRFFNVSPKAVDLFKKWLVDYHAAETLQEVFDQWEGMDSVTDNYLQARLRCEGKRGVVEFVRPRAPWDNNSSSNGPYNFNDEVMYLVLLFLTTPNCERLRLCPECEKCYVALRSKKYCTSLCGRRAASRRIVGENYKAKRKARIDECRTAYAKYRTLNPKPRQTRDEYVLREANRHLRRAGYRLGGEKMQVNFITRNAETIGIPKGEK
jgi:hypothetical protein